MTLKPRKIVFWLLALLALAVLAWLGLRNGIAAFNPQTGTSQQYSTFGEQMAGSVWSVCPYGKRLLFVATRQKGLWVFDRLSRKFVQQFVHEADNPYSLLDNEAMNLHIDRQENLWVAHWKYGLSYVNLRKNKFYIPPATRGNSFWQFLEGPDGNIWCCEPDKGIFVYTADGQPVDTLDSYFPEIQERLGAVYRLFRKHQVQDTGALIDIQQQLHANIEQVEHSGEEIEALTQAVKQLEKSCFEQGRKIHEQRVKSIGGLEKAVVGGLTDLAMESAQFKVELSGEDRLHPDGIDRVVFLFSANKGARLLPIKRIASGGELSRLNLVLKSLVATKMTMPTLIFDEIDSGISGYVSDRMGNMMRALAQNHQILCITHSPQIAAKGNYHYFVYKEEKAGQTETNVKLLGPEDRITELAIMLSTNPPTASALANARELLANPAKG